MCCEEGWAPKNWCFWSVVLEKTLWSHLNFNGMKPVHPKGNQSWIFTGRTDAEAEAPVLWPPLATWCEELTCCKRPWCWERLKAGGEGDDRGWDGWIASPTLWTEEPGRLQFLACHRVRHGWSDLAQIYITGGLPSAQTDGPSIIYIPSPCKRGSKCVCFVVEVQWLSCAWLFP